MAETFTMSMIGAVKNAVFGQAMRWMSDPRVSRVVGDPRVMNAAMKAMNIGGTVKAELDKASRFAAAVFGLATQEEVTALRSTIQNLEDTVAILESKTTPRPGGLPKGQAASARSSLMKTLDQPL